MRPTPTLGLLTISLSLTAACNDSDRGKQFFGPGSTGAMMSSGTNPGPGPGPGGLGAFTPTGNMNAGRFRHTATLLGDGRVLVVGGWGQPPALPELTSAEVWSPTTGMWQTTDSIATPASSNGFLNIGGNPNQPSARMDHAAVLLQNPGNPANAPVLIIGGMGQERFGPGIPAFESLFSCFTFDPATNSFTQQASLNVPRRGPLASVLPNGNVLVTGGQDQTPMPAGMGTPPFPPATIAQTVASSEIYNPQNNTWTPTGATAGLHGYGMAFAAGNQTNLVVNGAPISISTQDVFVLMGAGASPSNELFNSMTSTWTGGPAMTGNRVFFGGALDTGNGGRVFVAGGIDPNSLNLNGQSEFFNPMTNTWTPGPMLMNPRAFHEVTEIGGNMAAGTGDMLISGGETQQVNGPQTNVCEVYGTLTNSILGTVNMSTPREDHRAVRLSDGRILITGGFLNTPAPGVALNVCEIYSR